MRYLVFIIALFAAVQTNAQNNIVYGAGINYTNGAPTFTPPVRTSRVAIDTVTGKWYHFNTPGGWQLIGNTIEEIAGCTAPAYTPGKGDSKVVINNCSPQPELYFYNGSAWVLVGGGSVYAGEGIRIENDTIILDSLYVLRFRTGDTTDLNAGAVSWNAAEQTLDVVINQGAVTGQMFQEVLYFTKNQTGVQINDGAVVMAAGTTGNSGKILIAPAIADGSVNSEYILGLATQNLPNGGEGMVTHFGKVRGIQTNGANYGETWVDGDVLYCSAATPGYLTKVLPTAPNLKIPIAIVIHAHPSNGTLFVRPSHFPDLAQINDVQLSSPTNGQVLTYNSTLSRWENATPANQLQTLSTDGSAGNISISSGNTITLNVNDADASATNELQTLSVAANTATLSNSGGSVTIAGAGINTVGTAGTTITVTGTEVDGSTTNELQTLSTGTNTLTLSNGGGTVTVDTDPSTDVTGSGASGQVSFWTGAQTQSGDNGLFWDNGNKRLGINTTSPTSSLQINGASTVATGIQFNNTGSLGYIFGDGTSMNIRSGATEGLQINSSSSVMTSLSGGTGRFAVNLGALTTAPLYSFFGDGDTGVGRNASDVLTFYSGGERARFSGGNLLIGNTTGTARLHVVGSGTSSSTWTAQFHNSAGNNNALMIRDDGRVGIGTTSLNNLLTIAGSAAIPRIYIEAPTNTEDANIVFDCKRPNGGNIFTFTDQGRFSIGNGLGFYPTTGGSAAPISRAGGGVFVGEAAASTNTSLGAYVVLGKPNSFARTTTGVGNTASAIELIGTHSPSSTNIRYNMLSIIPIYNQTGTANGAFTGIDYNPTITSLLGPHYAATFRTGSVGIGTSAPDASAALDVTSTTQGILFPRMTTAQRDLIATPANGLVIYNSTTDKLQVRAGGAWVDLH